MATQYSNKPIVTDGLVYALDFGNPKSYVSGSSSAESLKYFTTTASLSGNPTFEELEGLLNLEDNKNVLTNKIFPELTITKAFTICTLVKVKSGGVSWNQRSYDASDPASRLDTDSTSIGHLVVDSAYLQGTNFRRNYPTDLTELTHITYRSLSGSLDVFINGVPVNTTGDASGMLRGSGLNLNGRDNSNSFWSGSIGNFYIYNRDLTSDEIYQNYLITAQRYGLPTNPKPYTVDENAYLFLSQSGITDPIITSSIDTFVRGLKANNLWHKMAVIYPFVGTGSEGINLTGSQKWNLKEPGIYPLSYNGAWEGSTSGSAPSGSGTYITPGVSPTSTFPYYVANNYHMSLLSYDTPVSSSYLMGTGMTEELAVSTLAGDYGTPAAAYSVRKVRTAYSGALMDVRRSLDNVTSSIGYVSNGDLDTGSLLDFVKAEGENTPGEFEGLAAAYSLRKVSSSYDGLAVDVRRSLDNVTSSIGFTEVGDLDTGSLLEWVNTTGSLPGAYDGLAAAYSLRRVSASYTGDAIEVRRDSDNVTSSFGFDSNGNLDTESVLNFLSSSAVLPGDTATPDAAFSLRKIVTSYNGYAIQIESASLTQDIGFNSDGTLDTGSIASFAGSGDAFVKIWYDQSGNNNHMSQSSATFQPKVYSGSLGSVILENGKPALQFDGIDDTLVSSFSSTQPLTSLLVAKSLTNATATRFILGDGDVRLVYTNAGSDFLAYAGGATPSFNAFNTNQNLFFTYVSGSSSRLGFNGGTLSSTTNLGSNTLGSLSIGGGTVYVEGTYQEVVIYKSDQTTNRSKIEGNINTYYNIYARPSGYVSQWYDQSGNGNHTTQTTASYQPLIVSSGSLITENGKPALSFDGNNRLISPTFTTITHPVTTFVAYTYTSITNNTYGYVHSVSSNSGFLSRNTSINIVSGQGVFSNVVATNNTPYLTYALFNETNSEIKVNNTLVTGSSGTENRVYNRVTLGDGLGNDYNGAYAMQGTISEFILYSGSQSANRTYIENNINSYYNIYTDYKQGYVAQWYDQSGNGRHATQTATGSQPLIVSSGSLIVNNGKPVIRSNQSQLNLSSNFNVGKTYTIFTTLQNTGYTDTFLGTNSPYQYLYYWQNASTTRQIVDGSTSIAFPGVGTDFKVLTTVRNATVSSSLYKNSNLLGTGSFTVNSDFSFRNLLGDNFNPPLYNFIGDVPEILIYNSDQSANRPLIENNINNYYNIYTGSNHGFVARWYDQSGNNRHAVQTATGSQPIIVESGSVIFENSRPAVQFDGAGNYLNTPSFSSLSNSSYFILSKANSANPQYVFSTSTWTPPFQNLAKRENSGPDANKRYVYDGTSVHLDGVNSLNQELSSLFFPLTPPYLTLHINNTQQSFSTSPVSALSPVNKYISIGRFDGNNTFHFNGQLQEFILYPSNQSSNREPIEYGINDYYNIYTQPTDNNWTTSSFTIKADSGSISGSLNNELTSGIASSGPLGLITVSRTGSNSLTIARNGVTSSFAVPASGALSTGLYLGAINNNGIALGNSPVNISFASVGTGLTGTESTKYFNLVNSLNYRLGRGVNAEYDAVLEYAILQGYTLPSVDQQALQNKLVSDLKQAGIWDKLDIFYVFATDGDQNFARLNWKNPSLYRTTNVTSDPIFRTNIGFTGPNRLNTNFPSTSGVNYTLNDASRHVWVYFSYGGNQRMDSAGGSNNNSMENRGGTYQSINSGPVGTSTTLSGTGMKSIHRLSSTSVIVLNGTTQQPYSAATTGLSSSPQHIFGGTVDISMYSMGASLINENSDYINAFQTYLTAISS